jgi:hypothetical protein
MHSVKGHYKRRCDVCSHSFFYTSKTLVIAQWRDRVCDVVTTLEVGSIVCDACCEHNQKRDGLRPIGVDVEDLSMELPVSTAQGPCCKCKGKRIVKNPVPIRGPLFNRALRVRATQMQCTRCHGTGKEAI